MSVDCRHFIIGYGSLINSISRTQTGETGKVWRVKLRGYERHWSVMSPEFGMSSVAVVKTDDHDHPHYCNGLLVEVPEDQFELFDAREKGYQRVQVTPSQIEAYENDVLPEGTYWIYITHEIVLPTTQCPISLSYVDVILAGCIELGEAFLEDLLVYTKGWEGVVLNDRQSPRYPRVQPKLNIEMLNPCLSRVTNLTSEELSISYEF